VPQDAAPGDVKRALKFHDAMARTKRMGQTLVGTGKSTTSSVVRYCAQYKTNDARNQAGSLSGQEEGKYFKLKESHAQHQAHWLERMMYKRVQAGPIMGPNLHTSFVTLQ
jgi:hypothetical protein